MRTEGLQMRVPDGAAVARLHRPQFHSDGQREVGDVVERGSHHGEEVPLRAVAQLLQQGGTCRFAVVDEDVMRVAGCAGMVTGHLALPRLQPGLQRGAQALVPPMRRHHAELPVQAESVLLLPVPAAHVAGDLGARLRDPHVALGHAVRERCVVARDVFGRAKEFKAVRGKARVGARGHRGEIGRAGEGPKDHALHEASLEDRRAAAHGADPRFGLH